MLKLPATAVGALAAFVLVLALVGGAVSIDAGPAFASTSTDSGTPDAYECAIDDPDALHSALVGDTGWNRTQRNNAAVVYRVAAERGLGDRAALIGIMAARTESRLYNYANFNVEESLEYDYDKIGSDHGSVGILRQDPFSGRGSVKDLMKPEYAAGEFYDELVAIDDWETMAPGAAAQAVQTSTSSEVYARYQSTAEKVVAHFAEHVTCTLIPGEWTHPVPGAALWSGFRTAERPGHDGLDFGADKGTEILAAGTGTVVRVRCNASVNGRDHSCNVDGSPQVQGCGWYVDIEHLDESVTRYCHMVSKPLVSVGDIVLAGQVIGYVGSSGNSSAPHLHFQTHTGGAPATSDNAVPPIEFLGERDVSVN